MRAARWLSRSWGGVLLKIIAQIHVCPFTGKQELRPKSDLGWNGSGFAPTNKRALGCRSSRDWRHSRVLRGVAEPRFYHSRRRYSAPRPRKPRRYERAIRLEKWRRRRWLWPCCHLPPASPICNATIFTPAANSFFPARRAVAALSMFSPVSTFASALLGRTTSISRRKRLGVGRAGAGGKGNQQMLELRKTIIAATEASASAGRPGGRGARRAASASARRAPSRPVRRSAWIPGRGVSS